MIGLWWWAAWTATSRSPELQEDSPTRARRTQDDEWHRPSSHLRTMKWLARMIPGHYSIAKSLTWRRRSDCVRLRGLFAAPPVRFLKPHLTINTALDEAFVSHLLHCLTQVIFFYLWILYLNASLYYCFQLHITFKAENIIGKSSLNYAK